jgi:hypothetical protein
MNIKFIDKFRVLGTYLGQKKLESLEVGNMLNKVNGCSESSKAELRKGKM